MRYEREIVKVEVNELEIDLIAGGEPRWI